MDLEIKAKEITVSHSSSRNYVTIVGAEQGEILDNFDITDIIRHFGKDDFLEAIGQSAAMEYFGIEEGED